MAEEVFQAISNENGGKETVNKLLLLLIQQFEGITEFSQSGLKSESLLETDKYLNKMLEYYKKNKKHTKRKNAKEIIRIIELIANINQIGVNP